MVDIFWNYPKIKEMESIAITFNVIKDVPEGSRFYLALLGGRLGDIDFYCGIQSDVSNPNVGSQGKGLIFSRWHSTNPADIRRTEFSWWETATYEGDFISTRRKFKWNRGKYTLKLIKLDTEHFMNNKGTWIGLFLFDHQNVEEYYSGALRFENKGLHIDASIYSFFEFFGRDDFELSKMPGGNIQLFPPVINGRILPDTAYASFPQDRESYGQDNGNSYCNISYNSQVLDVIFGKSVQRAAPVYGRFYP
ncbi:hypothetical protein FGU65_02845 [Methanoculleus sp. FWC-SCC1]|uniref:Uncharacterized protein n=1 Tax=Methanoculleus frigidifontis TaxID=2584085 RepID=A0ABT8M7D6_9EURY|nr:hypothetical protein [Methanoculleus sp. FWC-SCC1]MDN7023840.1 hypothetical protein [Methanoculleus sp. FWC-SCC1]